MIRDLYAGWPGCTHDARVFPNSSLGMEVSRNESELVADRKYIIGKWLIICVIHCQHLMWMCGEIDVL